MTCFQDLWVFCCCCYWCYFFMSCGVHVAKNYTNYILMVRFSSSLLLWEFSKIISFYPIVVDMSIHCSSIEQKNIEFLPRNLGAKLYCTLDILMTEIIQSTTPRGSFALFKSLQWLWTSLVVQWLRLCFPVQGLWVWCLVREQRSHMPLGPKKTEHKQQRQCYNKFNNNLKKYLVKKIQIKAYNLLFKMDLHMWLLFTSLCFHSPLMMSFPSPWTTSSSPHVPSISLPCLCMFSFSVSLPFFFFIYLDLLRLHDSAHMLSPLWHLFQYHQPKWKDSSLSSTFNMFLLNYRLYQAVMVCFFLSVSH